MKQKAAALNFIPSLHSAPRVVMSGEGRIASKICQIAKENQILTIKDEVLVESILKIPIGTEIPRELYESVGIIFRYLLSSLEEKNN